MSMYGNNSIGQQEAANAAAQSAGLYCWPHGGNVPESAAKTSFYDGGAGTLPTLYQQQQHQQQSSMPTTAEYMKNVLAAAQCQWAEANSAAAAAVGSAWEAKAIRNPQDGLSVAGFIHP
jgi:hypothetical protein